ncbi:dual specificity protein phosphatase family protein [Gayadomonas joobiniege]|uniref:phosphatase domain-containing putative toxin n=1 Tax=Gayadomonas joobiniege TaxID=1234606 RepID=UPI000374FB8E|nr:dual specificity protein phosphatase family protein [Gayadomonas joobiniege]
MNTNFIDTIWVLETNKLAGMATPPAQEIEMLTRYGIHAVVSVRDDKTNLTAYETAGLPFLWLPTTGGTSPTREAVAQFIHFVKECHQQGLAVAVHCSSGRKRTGTLLAAYLVCEKQMPAQQAIEKIRHANPQVELSSVQIEFLQLLERDC